MPPILDEYSLELISHSAEQTRRFGIHLGALLRPRDVVCLRGELGVGKTCLTQGIGEGMGVEGPVTSPSFTLVNEYRVPGSDLWLHHIDLYRLEDAVTESLDIGLDEYLYGDGVCVIEWSERAETIMPRECLTIEMRYIDDHKRSITLRAGSERFRELLEGYKKRVFSPERLRRAQDEVE